MPSFSDPFRPPWPSGRRTVVRDSDLRVSDAERREVADALSQHYGDGRLDQAELEERLSQAMGAKTRGDLAGLLADFPRPEDGPGARHPGGRQVGPGHARRLLGAALVVVLVLLTTGAASALFRPHVPWFLVVVVLVLLLRRGHHHEGRSREGVDLR